MSVISDLFVGRFVCSRIAPIKVGLALLSVFLYLINSFDSTKTL